MRSRSFSGLFAASVASLLAVAPAPAYALPFTLQSSTVPAGNQAYSGVSVHFLVNSPITVTALGIYDSLQDGFGAGPLTADLMTSTGIIQASQVFDAISPGTLDGLYRFKSISAVTLAPGDYILAGYGWTGSDLEYNCNNAGLAGCSVFNDGGGLLTYVDSPYGGGGDLPGTVPTNVLGTTNYFSAANLQYTAAAVPEPLTLTVFGAGLVGAAALRRRKAKKA